MAVGKAEGAAKISGTRADLRGRQPPALSKTLRRLTGTQLVRARSRRWDLRRAEEEVKAGIAIFGGTVRMVVDGCRKVTKDIPVIFHPAGVVEPWIRQAAAERKLPQDSMNAGVEAFVGMREACGEFSEPQIPGLGLRRPAPDSEVAHHLPAALPSAAHSRESRHAR